MKIKTKQKKQVQKHKKKKQTQSSIYFKSSRFTINSVKVLNVHTAFSNQRILNGAITDKNTSSFVSKIDVSRTPNMYMILPCDQRPYFPPHAPIGAYHQPYEPTTLLISQRDGVVRSDRNSGSVNKRRPDVVFFVALIRRRDSCPESYLLVPVSSVDVETVVVDSDLGVRVT